MFDYADTASAVKESLMFASAQTFMAFFWVHGGPKGKVIAAVVFAAYTTVLTVILLAVA